MAILHSTLLKQQGSEFGEIDSPVAPDVTTIGLKIGVLVALGVEIGTQVVVVLDEEVGLANANPEERGLLGKEGINLLVEPFVGFP